MSIRVGLRYMSRIAAKVAKAAPGPEDFEFQGASSIRYAGWEPHLEGSCMADQFLEVVLNAMAANPNLFQGSSGVRS